MESVSSEPLTCRLCGRVHYAVRLQRGQRALCRDCGASLPKSPHASDAAMAFTVTALILAVPAVQLPLVVVRKFGVERASYLWTGVRGLWADGMPLLSVWVALCGVAVPLALLSTLTMLVHAGRRSPSGAMRTWLRVAQALQHWSMPEVQVLAVLVAFVKIGALVTVEPGLGLWFYGAMTLAMLLAWHTADLEVES